MLSRLTLIMTHCCNMDCAYCYAQGGDYGTLPAKMSLETAVCAIEHFAHTFDGISEIMFFGGEPLLELQTIQLICDNITQFMSVGTLSDHPQLTMVTNGTLINPEIADWVKRCGVNITLSLDGPSEIHNKHRRLKSGEPSFDLVLNAINALKSVDAPFTIECTYTAEHLKLGYSQLDTYKYLLGLGASSVVITEQVAQGCYSPLRTLPYREQFIQETRDLLEFAVEEFIAGNKSHFSEFRLILNSVIHRPEILAHRFCGAGRNTFTVNPLGEVYPCHILNGMPTYCLGHYRNVVAESDIIPCKDDFNSCGSCSVRDYCRACPARLFKSGDNNNSGFSADDCEIKRMVLTAAVLAIAKYVSNH